MKTILLLLIMIQAHALDLVEHLKFEEGFRSKVYYCTKGYTTIGYGHRCSKHTSPVTKAQAHAILLKDIAYASRNVELLVGVDAPLEVKQIVTAMIFQLGYAETCRFKKTLAYIRARNYISASKEMLRSDWYRKDTPARAKRLSILMSQVSY